MGKRNWEEELERAIEKATGEPLDALQRRTLAESRRIAEARHGAPMRVVSSAPRILSKEEVQKLVGDS